jgi:hypothetical protein
MVPVPIPAVSSRAVETRESVSVCEEYVVVNSLPGAIAVSCTV